MAYTIDKVNCLRDVGRWGKRWKEECVASQGQGDRCLPVGQDRASSAWFQLKFIGLVYPDYIYCIIQPLCGVWEGCISSVVLCVPHPMRIQRFAGTPGTLQRRLPAAWCVRGRCASACAMGAVVPRGDVGLSAIMEALQGRGWVQSWGAGRRELQVVSSSGLLGSF